MALADPPGTFALHGLRVRSWVPLSGVAAEPGPVDVELTGGRSGTVPDVPPDGRLLLRAEIGGAGRLYLAESEAGFTLRLPACCDFVVGPGLRSVECVADPMLADGMAAILAGGLLLAVLLQLRGECVLHASAVAVDGAAVAFTGVSGGGKSTMAALLVASGALLVSDDLLRVRCEVPVCWPGGPELRIRAGARSVVDAFPAAPPVRTTADGRMAVQLPVAEGPLPLRAIVVPLRAAGPSALRTTTLAPGEALARLGTCPRVGGWTHRPTLRRQFEQHARIVAQVPVMEMVVPWTERIDAGSGTRILHALADAGVA